MLLGLVRRAEDVLLAAGFLVNVVVTLAGGVPVDARFLKYQVILVWVDCAAGCTEIPLLPLFTSSFLWG